MAKKTIKGNYQKINGTSKNDRYTVKGHYNTVKGAKGNDTIILSSGAGHKFYGNAGNDTFVIGKNATGSAVVKDYGTSKGNKDKLKVSGGVVKRIVIDGNGNNLKFVGGKSAAITLQKNTRYRTVSIIDSRGSWKVYDKQITLGTNFTGTMDATNYLAYTPGLVIDASAVTRSLSIIGTKEANDIILGKADGGVFQGMGGDDRFLLSTGDYHTVYGDDEAGKLKKGGKDTIMVQAGSSHKLYGGKGDDTIYLFSGAGGGSTLDGGAGNDRIAIEHKAGSNHTVKGGAGADQIYIDSGKNQIHGGSGADTIKLGQKLNGSTAVEDGNYIYGEGGVDTISISSGNSHSIHTGSGADNVFINSGKEHYIYNDGGGNDYIEIGSKAGDGIYIYGYDKAASAEKVRIEGGSGHTVKLYEGSDTITIVGGGTGHKIKADGGNDVISVTGGHSHEISGSGGADKISLYNIKGNGNGYGNQTTIVYAGDGADTITVKNSSDARIYGENGIDTINVSNSRSIMVQPYGDCGKVTVDSCVDTKISLSGTTGSNVNTVSVSGTGNDVTIDQAYEAKDNITVFWSNNFGKLTIDASRKGGEGNQYEDTLTIRNGYKSDFNFVKSGAQDLYINGKNGGSIFIDGFYSYDDAMSFTGGISFNGTIYRYADIVKDLRFKYS